MTSVVFAQAVLPDKHYTTHDGLPQIQVMDIMQDSRGYIWIATKKGVARFNGEKFTKVVLPEFLTNHINHIYEDEKGRLYFFTGEKEGTVLQYDGQNFKTLTINKNLLRRSYLNKIKNNKLFVATNSKEVLVYGLDSLKQQASLFLPDTIDLISKLENDRLVGFKQKGNILYDIETKEITYDAKDQFFNIKMNQRDQEKIMVRKPLINGRKMHLLDSKLKGFDLTFEKKYPNYSIINNLELSNNNKLTFLTSEDEVLKVSGNHVVNKYKVSNTTRVICMMDIDDNLWISHENGVEFYSKNHISTVPLDLVSDAWSYVPFGNQNQYLYSSYSDGLYDVDLDKETSKPIFLPYQDRINYGASKDKEGNVYLPGNRYLLKYEGGNKFKSFPLGQGNCSLVTHYDSLNNTVLVGGHKSLGILYPDKDKIEYIRDETDTIVSRYIVAIEPKDADNYWLGTYNDLAVFEQNSKSYSSYNHLFPVDSSGALSLAVDSRTKNLWIGNTKGLWCLNSKTNKLTEIGREMFQDEYITSLLVLPNQILAIGSSNGFSILNLREYNDNSSVVIKTFNHRNGFLGEEVAQSGLMLNDQTLYIPSSTYLSYVNINELTFEEEFSNLLISEINDKSVIWNNSENYKIAPGVNNISISFEGLGFNKPHETRYSYFLEQVDKEWSPWTSYNKSYYNNLSSGTYTFKVKSQTSNFGFGNKAPEAKITFEVDLPLYKEPNFYKYAAFTFLGLSLLSFYLFWRYRRTRNVTIIQDQQIKYLEIQALQSQMNPHFIFNVISTIQALVLKKETEEANKHLVSFSKLIRRFLDATVSSNLDRNNINKNNNVSLRNEIELIKLYVNFELLQYKNKFDFFLDVKDEEILNLSLPPMIIQPFVENAIKHGLLNKETKGKLHLTFYQTEDSLICTISDNGIGRENARLLQSNSLNLYPSRGSALVFQRVEILNSLNQDITISTLDRHPPESGTVVTISFTKKYII